MKRDSAHLIPVAPARDSRSATEQSASAALDTVSEPLPLPQPLAEWLYRAPRWLPTAHAQTIVPALFAQRPAVKYRRERWTTPDGDFIDLDWVSYAADGENGPTAAQASPSPDPAAPLFVLFHGLEGNSDS